MSSTLKNWSSVAMPCGRASLILIPSMLYVVLPAHSATAQAQIIPDERAQTTVDSYLNIEGGYASDDGSNLFHSFKQFDLPSGEIANFITQDEDVRNIIGTINGGQSSTIDGTLQVSGGDANLYLVNPAGILLGPDATLNLPGSFSATTATGIEFADGERLNVGDDFDYEEYEDLEGDPTALLFDYKQAGAVVNLGDLDVNEGERLELVGGTVINEGRLFAPQGAITAAAVEGGSVIRFSQSGRLLSFEVEAVDQVLESAIAPTSLASMLVGQTNQGTQLVVDSEGTVQIAGIDVSEQGGSAIVAGTLTTAGGSVAEEAGDNISVLGRDVSLIDVSVDASADGDVFLMGDRIALNEESSTEVVGETVQFRPLTTSRDISIGTEAVSEDSGNYLQISDVELSLIMGDVEVGDSATVETGTIFLGEGITDIENKITILGGSRLVGPDVGLTYLLEEDRNGSIDGTDVEFSFIENLIGGDGDDIFRVSSNGDISDFSTISGGGGTNSLDYGNFSNALRVDLEQLPIDNIQKILGSLSADSALSGQSRENLWKITGDGRGVLNEQLEFERFNEVVGGDDVDTLDYSAYELNTSDSVLVNFSGVSTGVDRFSAIEKIVGSRSGESEVLGSSGDDVFTIGDTSTIANDNLEGAIELHRFSTFKGSGGNDTFAIEQISSNVSILGGISFSESSNRLLVDGEDGAVVVSRKDGGYVEYVEGVLNFDEIQNLENSRVGPGLMSIVFEGSRDGQALSQITGSIDSKDSDLSIIGDDINIGMGVGGDNQNGAISGAGRLTIQPLSSDVDLEIGGQDSNNSRILNITDGELAAIQDGFREVVFGGEEMLGDISVDEDVRFQDATSLITGGSIDVLGGQVLIREGDLSIESGQSVVGNSIRSLGGDVLVSAQGSVELSDIETVSDRGSGDINIEAVNGTISTGALITSETRGSGKAGSVSLVSPGLITIDVVQAEGEGRDSGLSANRVYIETSERFLAIGARRGRSISTEGAEEGNGSIQIVFGDEEAIAEPFFVGRRKLGQRLDVDDGTLLSGTAGRIVSEQVNVSPRRLSGSYNRGDVFIINRGTPLAPVTETSPERLPESAPVEESTEQLLIPEISTSAMQQMSSPAAVPNVTSRSSIGASEEELFDVIETRVGREFSQYLSSSEAIAANAPASLRQVQDQLASVEQISKTTPALVYVYFVPDAESETAITLEDRGIKGNDQLEVMLVTADEKPILRRRWGVTRSQVDAVTQELRQQVTSQFSTEQQYLPPAQQLYEWIVAPIAEALEEKNVQSLGFVMDTGLRTTPLAALHDGDRFLVENYSVGILPTFSLTDFDTSHEHGEDFRQQAVLAMGASEFESQPDLPAVDEEIALITQELWQGDAFLNENFVLENLRAQMAKNDYGIVHLATHATFQSDDLEGSYIQMWDEQLSLNDVTQLGLKEADIGLIILSACNTAVGDLNAEYGFAGFAINAGSPSALASIWPVSDEGTLGFMSQFYKGLRRSSIKAGALQQAQTQMIKGEVGIDYGEVYGPGGETIVTIPELSESGQWDFSHPFYWSAFTMIGNPW